MKTKIFFLLSLSVFSSQALFALTPAEMAEARAMANNALNQGQSSGESIFNNKHSTQTDFTSSSIKIDPFSTENTSQNQNAQTNQVLTGNNLNPAELSEEQLNLLKAAARMKNLNALQQKFFTKKYSGFENTKHLKYEKDKTQRIRTRFAMATTLIFPSKISSYILGDKVGFEIEELPNLDNALAIKPTLIGIDTSLTVFTSDKKMHSFYLFSTDYKSNNDPDLIVHINDEEAKLSQNSTQNNNYLIIKEGIAEIKVKKDEIYANYLQKALKRNSFLMAEEIFNDKQFTYFKFDKEKMPQIPSVFVVNDGQDSPIETKIIGNYIIAETTASKFTIRLGDSYICVERLKPNDKRIKKQNTTSSKMNKLFEEMKPKTEVELRKYK
ncbi:TrbG/VirB9 family P-type conjugative transfer protein [Campylobacter upsaliensis]